MLLAGVVGSACLRSLLPAAFLLAVALALGVDWPGIVELALAGVLVMGLAAAAACYATVARAALPHPAGGAAHAGRRVRRDPLHDRLRAARPAVGLAAAIADVNPVTHVLEGVRQGFVGDSRGPTTWPALLAVAGLLSVFGGLAVRGMRRQGLKRRR